MGETRQTLMADLIENDPTPINARPERRAPEALEDLSLALREHVLWPIEDRLLGLGDRGRAAVAGGAVVLALGLGIGGFSLLGSGSSEPAGPSPVAALTERTPHSAPVSPKPQSKPEPTLHGAAPVFEPVDGKEKIGKSKGVESAAASTPAGTNSGNPATDTITSSPAARPAAATTSTSTATTAPDGAL